jgi:hypothetical protein
MDKISHNLSIWFKNRGLLQEELPDFIKDVIQLIDEEENRSLNIINQKLEELGWGIQILDETAYNQFLFLHRNKAQSKEFGFKDTFMRFPQFYSS